MHISVHLKPFARHVHSDNLYDRAHLKESNCNTASGAGEPLIHSMASCPLSYVVHQFLLDLAKMASFASSTSKLKPGS